LAHGKRAKNEKFFVKNKRKMAKEIGGRGDFWVFFWGLWYWRAGLFAGAPEGLEVGESEEVGVSKAEPFISVTPCRVANLEPWDPGMGGVLPILPPYHLVVCLVVCVCLG